jgi:hypothetical protein
MSYHGIGLYIDPNLLATKSTVDPVTQSKEPSPSVVMAKELLPVTQPVTLPVIDYAPISEPTTHQAPPALPPNYSAEAMGCHGKLAVPIKPGDPGYPGFLCVDFQPLIAEKIISPTTMINAFAAGATGGSGGGGGVVSMTNMQTQPTAEGMAPATDFPGSNPPGAYETDTKQPTGTVTPASFAAACQQVGGTMGTPNCCKLPNGVNMGMDGGKLVQVTQCSVGAAKGLAGNLPLIAGAAIIALLLARGL